MKHIIMERFNYSGLWIKYSKFYESGYGHANRSNKRPMIMKTNIGNKKLFLIRHVRKFGKVWYDPISVINILGWKTWSRMVLELLMIQILRIHL